MAAMRAVVLAVVGALAAGCLGPDVGVFYPTKTSRYELPKNHVPGELVAESTVETPDGERLAMVTAVHGDGPGRAVILVHHGQGGDIDDAWERVMRLWDLGFDVAVVDYRGYGKSTGEPSEAGLYTDAQAFFDAVAADPRFDAGRLVVWGHSLGTGVASHLALTAPGCALVLESPFTSLAAMIEDSSPYGIPSDWFTDSEFDTLGRIADVPLPLVVAHGTDDSRIPIWMGERVYERAHDPKRFVPAEGAGHDDVLAHAAPEVAAAMAAVAACAAP